MRGKSRTNAKHDKKPYTAEDFIETKNIFAIGGTKNPYNFIACVKTRKSIQVKSTICNKINSGSNHFSLLNNEAKHGLQASFQKIS